MKETDAIIIMRNYLWTHKIEMSHKEREALQRIIDAMLLYRTAARGNCNQVATNLQPTCNVLRCNDCRYRELDGDVTHYYWCRINERPVDDTDYCAWGMESEVEE